MSERAGLTSVLGTQKFSGLASLIIYILILVPVLIAGSNGLNLTVIITPAINILVQFLSVILKLLAAAVLVFIAYIVAKIITGLARNLLQSIGHNGF